ncbi:DUF2299 family protein [Candidatus Nitrosocosmicus sp. T]
MTDDNKELIFDSIIRWLRESNFIISEERRTIVTSEFYAKAYFQSVQEKFFEIISTSGIEKRFILSIRLNLSEQQLDLINDLEHNKKLGLYDKINPATLPQSRSMVVKDKQALLQKIVSIDPKAIYSKGIFMQDVSELLEAAKKLEINFNEYISNHSE